MFSVPKYVWIFALELFWSLDNFFEANVYSLSICFSFIFSRLRAQKKYLPFVLCFTEKALQNIAWSYRSRCLKCFKSIEIINQSACFNPPCIHKTANGNQSCYKVTNLSLTHEKVYICSLLVSITYNNNLIKDHLLRSSSNKTSLNKR